MAGVAGALSVRVHTVHDVDGVGEHFGNSDEVLVDAGAVEAGTTYRPAHDAAPVDVGSVDRHAARFAGAGERSGHPDDRA